MYKSILILLFAFSFGLVSANSGLNQGWVEAYYHINDSEIVDNIYNKYLFYKSNEEIQESEYIALIDLGKHSSEERFYLINLHSGEVDAFLTAHGRGSDLDNDGWAETFNNISGSGASSLGAYRVGSRYISSSLTRSNCRNERNCRNTEAIRLHGLEETNSNALNRGIVIHRAWYVRDNNVGRSLGCPSLKSTDYDYINSKLTIGSFVYIFDSRNN